MNKEADALLAKAEEKLSLARKLIDLGEYEGSLSPSYYAMLFAARGALSEKGSFPRTHEGTRSEFARVFVVGGGLPRRLAKYFDEGRALREKSDYAPEFETSERDARDAYDRAREFTTAVKELSFGPPKRKSD